MALAIDAYRFFGAEHLAELVEEARAIAAPAVDESGGFDSLDLSEGDQDALDALTGRLPDDSEVEAIFKRHLAAHPADFENL